MKDQWIWMRLEIAEIILETINIQMGVTTAGATSSAIILRTSATTSSVKIPITGMVIAAIQEVIAAIQEATSLHQETEETIQVAAIFSLITQDTIIATIQEAAATLSLTTTTILTVVAAITTIIVETTSLAATVQLGTTYLATTATTTTARRIT